MTITTEEAERLADRVECVIGVGEADAIRSLAAERDALMAENARLREALRAIAEDCEADYPPSHGAIKYAARAALGEKE
jgi:hypothetical protein